MVLSRLAASLCLFAPVAFAQAPAREALYAVNAVPILGLTNADFGRFFDEGPRWVRRSDVVVPGRVELPRAPQPPKRFPFTLEIPEIPPAPFVRTFDRLLARGRSARYDALIRDSSARNGLDPRLVKSVIAAESEFAPRAKSPAGALGLMQVMPRTAGSVGVEGRSIFDPAANIRAGTAYLAYLFERAWQRYHLKGVAYSRAPAWLVQRIVAAYNAGPRFLATRRLYSQTRDYVRRVLLFYRSAVTELAPKA
jgi:soluble lytic murein transglycosylase-like protein